MRSSAVPWLAVIGLASCWTPTDTGPRSMVGHVLDPSGAPLPGLTVSTVESNAVTDAAGYYGVNYKAPNLNLHFGWRGVTFQRSYRPEDDHHQIDLRLPDVSDRQFTCETDDACQVQVVWDLGGGFTATSKGTCDPDVDNFALRGPADGNPSQVTCVAGAAGPEQTLVPKVRDGVMVLQPPPVSLTAKLFTTDVSEADPTRPALPANCALYADGVPMNAQGPGQYLAQVFGRVQISGTCDGIPVTPRMMLVRMPASIDVEWHGRTPTLDLRPIVPAASRVALYALAGRIHGWSIEVDAMPDGLFHLPRLAPGTYTVGVNTGTSYLSRVQPAEEVALGGISLAELPFAVVDGKPVEVGEHAFVGHLRLEKPQDEGPIQVSRYIEPPQPD